MHANPWPCNKHAYTIETISTSSTTQIQSITPTQTAALTNTLIRILNTSFLFSTIIRVDPRTSMTPVTVSPTSGIITLTPISPSQVLTPSGPSVVVVTTLLPPQSQPNGDGGSSVATIPSDTGQKRNRNPSNTGLIVGLVFLFLVLIIVSSIVIILLVIIILRKKKEKEIKSKLTSLASSICMHATC